MVVPVSLTLMLLAVTSSTVIGAAGNDSFNFTGGPNTSIVGGDGVNTFTPSGTWSAAPSLLVALTTPSLLLVF